MNSFIKANFERHIFSDVASQELSFSGPLVAGRHHLGDMFFLRKISENLSNLLQSKESSGLRIQIALAKNLDDYSSPALGLDFSKRIIFSPEINILYFLKKIHIFQDSLFLREKGKFLIFSPEIKSSHLRIVGLKRRLEKLCELAYSEGLRIVLVGSSTEICRDLTFIEYRLTGISNVRSFILRNKSEIHGFLGFDNYWMHESAALGLRRYVVQRHKFSYRNLINHVGILNNIASVGEATYYC